MALKLVLPCVLLLLGSFVLVANAASAEELALRTAILSSGPGTVVLRKNVFLTADLPALPDNKKLTVRGRCGTNGRVKCVISGSNKYRHFYSSLQAPVFLVLDNLIITGTKASNGTAAVNIGGEGTTLSARNVKFSDNPRALELYIVHGIIRSCLFLRHTNNAVYSVSEEGLGDDVRFVNCRFSANKASPGQGGGAVYVGKYASVTIIRCRFSGNSADYRGGALRLYEAYGVVSRSSFVKNTATEAGGALTAYNSGLKVTSSLFQENVALTLQGGAVRVGAEEGVGTFATFEKTTFLGNKAPKALGGAFFLDTSSHIVFCRSNLTGNTGRGGVVSNGYVNGPDNTISTNPRVTIPAVSLAPRAKVVYTTTKCR